MSCVNLTRSLLRLTRPLALGFLIPLACGASAATLNVPSVSYPTIQSALSAAASGDTVKVASGVYSEDVILGTSGVTLKLVGSVSVKSFTTEIPQYGSTR
jgi:pectin methylesterase-like acyl-CoA thioesterase